MRYQIQEMGVGGILDQAIALVRNHFGLLLGIMLVLFIPFNIASNLLIQWFVPGAEEIMAGEGAPDDMLAFAGAIWLMLLPNFLFVYPVTNAAIIHAVAGLYLEKPVTAGSAFARAFRVLLPLLGTGLLAYLAIFGGYLLLIIPGIVFTFWFMFVTQVVVIEGTAGIAALKRSRQLMGGNVGIAFLLSLLLGVIGWGVNMGSALIAQPQLSVIVSVLLQACLFIFAGATWVVFYFTRRCKLENFDLTILADQVAAADAPSGRYNSAP